MEKSLVEKVSQAQFNEKIVKYVMHSMPLQTVNDTYFKQIFEDTELI